MRTTEGLSPERIAKRQREAAEVQAISAITDRILEMRRREFVGAESLEGIEVDQIVAAAGLLGELPEHVVVANVHNTWEADQVRERARHGADRTARRWAVGSDPGWELFMTVSHTNSGKTVKVVLDTGANALFCTRQDAEEIMNGNFERSSVLVMLLKVRSGNPGLNIDWAKFQAFDDFNLCHDFYGIVKHAEVPSGKLDGRFLPRCARGTTP